MPSSRKRTVVLGLLGTTLDTGRQASRWERWRPTICAVQQPDLLVDRFELLYQERFADLARTILSDIRTVSPETDVRPHQVPLEDAWDFEEVYGALHDFARAYPFAPDQEDYLVHITTGTHVAQICLFLLVESRHIPARLLQTSPPQRSDPPPACGRYTIIDLDLSRYDRLATRFEREREEGHDFLKSGIATRNTAFNRLIEQIEVVALRSRAPILLTGPTGAGKSHLARRIYELKRARRQIEGPFVEVNCATLRGDSAMSALFGHRKGAFTGALADRPGLLRAADSGLLFLDEIGELGLDEQAMLLRAIEDKTFLPLGSDREARSDFQLIAGTNRDLQAAAAAGRFRDDLLARINLWTFTLPPLRERPEDIEPNLDYELERHARATGGRVTFSREARERFLAFATAPDAAWAGNFRDLAAAVTRMATLAPASRISVDQVDEEIARLRRAWRHAPPGPGAAGGAHALDGVPERFHDLLGGLDLFDRVQLAEVLRVCLRSRTLSQAGRELFAVSRAAKENPNDADRLRKYLARFGLQWSDLHPAK